MTEVCCVFWKTKWCQYSQDQESEWAAQRRPVPRAARLWDSSPLAGFRFWARRLCNEFNQALTSDQSCEAVAKLSSAALF